MELKNHEQQLLHVSCELREAARAVEELGDNVVAGELRHLQMILRAFAINPNLRAREDGERTSKEWSQFGKFMLHLIETHQQAVETILGLLKATESAEEEEEEMKNMDENSFICMEERCRGSLKVIATSSPVDGGVCGDSYCYEYLQCKECNSLHYRIDTGSSAPFSYRREQDNIVRCDSLPEGVVVIE